MGPEFGVGAEGICGPGGGAVDLVREGGVGCEVGEEGFMLPGGPGSGEDCGGGHRDGSGGLQLSKILGGG